MKARRMNGLFSIPYCSYHFLIIPEETLFVLFLQVNNCNYISCSRERERERDERKKTRQINYRMKWFNVIDTLLDACLIAQILSYDHLS